MFIEKRRLTIYFKADSNDREMVADSLSEYGPRLYKSPPSQYSITR